MARFCTSCGSPMDDGAVFCSKCGKGVGGSTTNAGIPPAATIPATTGLADNMAGALAYVTIIPAIVFLILAPYNTSKFVRFHAFQSIFLFLAWFVVDSVLAMTILLWVLIHLVNLLFVVLAVICALKAYGGAMWKLPVIGDFSAKQAGA